MTPRWGCGLEMVWETGGGWHTCDDFGVWSSELGPSKALGGNQETAPACTCASHGSGKSRQLAKPSVSVSLTLTSKVTRQVPFATYG